MNGYTRLEMEADAYKKLFKRIARTESGEEQNLEEIERRLTHLKKGRALSYPDLELIAEPAYWKFSKHWLWPAKSQIENKLATTSGFFRDLPGGEIRVIRCLSAIFKNIALVSIILRFARPDLYAIYSRPNLQILKIERGKSDVDEYMNYIREMRVLRESFGAKTVAEVDQIIWTIFHVQGQYAEELMKILAEKLPENLSAKELMLWLSTDPLRIAKEYLKRGDFMTSGFWAAKAFEKFLDEECRSYGIVVHDEAHRRSKMIKALHEWTTLWGKVENRKLLYDTKSIRNIIVPGTKKILSKDVEIFILLIEELLLRAFRGRR